MRKLIIIRGNSGSGKSSLAQRLQKHFGRDTMLISQDMIRRQVLFTHDGKDNKALALLSMLLEYGYANSRVTILEGILHSVWYRKLFEKALEVYGKTNIHAYYYDLSFEETLRRHECRDKKNEFGQEEMKRWWNEKDKLDLIEEKVLDETISLEAAMDRVVLEVETC